MNETKVIQQLKVNETNPPWPYPQIGGGFLPFKSTHNLVRCQDGEKKIRADFAELHDQMGAAFRNLEDF